MWVKVDDAFVEHWKVEAAAKQLGSNGFARAIAVWLEALCFSARNLTDGFVSVARARKFISDRRPIDVLDVLSAADVRLMRKVKDGYQFHDYEHYQPSASKVKEKRAKDRKRKAVEDATKESGRNGAGIHTEPFTESARNPKRSRARSRPDPVPSRPVQKQKAGNSVTLFRSVSTYHQGQEHRRSAGKLVA